MNPHLLNSSFSRASRAVLALCAATSGLWLGATAAIAAPSHIVITVPAGAPGAAALPGLMADWRKSGLVSDAFLLDSTQAKDPAFAEVAVLEFPDDTCLGRWQQAGAPAIGAGVIVTPVDRLSHGETFPRDSTKAIFLVAEYDVLAAPEKYKEYVEGYVAPEMESMRLQKVLTSYFLYAAKDKASAPWHSMLVMEFRDSVAYGRREAVMASVRKELEAKPDWKALSDAKTTIRKERTLTESAWTLLPAPALADLPSYKPQYHVTGTIRILGSFLKFAVAALEDGFVKYQPDAQFASNFSTSSEGSIGGLCTGVSDLAPAGDDAKIPDMMPFFNVYGYLPTELSVGTGDYEKRGALWPAVFVVNKDNPIAHLNMDQLDRIFGSERTGGWEIGNNPDHNILFTAEYARGPETNIRTWGQLGLTGEWADKPIQTYGYIAPGFAVYFQRRLMHWSTKYNPNFREFVEPKQAEGGDNGKPVSSDRMLDEISKDKYAIGWAAMFHAKYYPDLKFLAIAQGSTENYVAYTPENVANHSYPMTRDCFFYVNKEPGRALDPKVREFMMFVLSREGQQIIAHTGFFYPLNADYLAEQRKKIE